MDHMERFKEMKELKAEELIKKMSLEEKIAQMGQCSYNRIIDTKTREIREKVDPIVRKGVGLNVSGSPLSRQLLQLFPTASHS